jgi:hypothetical protein
VDPGPDTLLVRKSGSAGNRTWTSGSVETNSDHWTTEAVSKLTGHAVISIMYSTFVLKAVLVSSVAEPGES